MKRNQLSCLLKWDAMMEAIATLSYELSVQHFAARSVPGTHKCLSAMISDKYDKRGDATARGLTDRKIVLAVSVGVVLAVLLFCGQKALDEQAVQLTATAAAGVRRRTNL